MCAHMLSLTDRWMYACNEREIWERESGLLCIGEKAARVWLGNRTIDRSVVVVDWCDAMRCEGSKMKCGRVDEGCFDFGKRADVMSE